LLQDQLGAEIPNNVADFIEPMFATWNTQALHQWFLPMDVDAICSIPLSTRRLTDIWAWHYEKNGILMVRSMYQLLVETKR
jgi:hypothetical protein